MLMILMMMISFVTTIEHSSCRQGRSLDHRVAMLFKADALSGHTSHPTFSNENSNSLIIFITPATALFSS
jgi:hypothetical protein